ncbi:MAG TPA: hypothetical protein IAB56_00685 [Candidatus Scybalousia intestinigallinarum]|nr:hypothetical protein [Candidatus Scybalousia intestinigallinarum]
MICPKCKHETEAVKFCGHCGALLTEYIEENQKKQDEKKYRLKFRISLVLIIVFVIGVGAVMGTSMFFSVRNFNRYQDKEESKKVEPQYATEDDEPIVETYSGDLEFTDEEKQQDLDDDGLSTSQELELGTNPIFKDTDGDGLTDGEEVNIYHSDPLKYSTSGDDISDYLKVKKGLDIHSVYSEKDMQFETKTVKSTVKLIPSDLASEIDGTFKEYSKDTRVGAIERTFSVYSFIGKIEYKVEEKNAILLVEYNGKYQEFDRYDLKNGVLTIDIQSDEDWAKNFVITTKSNYQQYTEQGVED